MPCRETSDCGGESARVALHDDYPFGRATIHSDSIRAIEVHASTTRRGYLASYV